MITTWFRARLAKVQGRLTARDPADGAPLRRSPRPVRRAVAAGHDTAAQGTAGRGAARDRGDHPRRVLAGAVRPLAWAAARGGPGGPRVRRVEPGVPAGTGRRRLAGDVRGRGGRHRPAG